MKIVAFAGGVGGAKFAQGLYQVLDGCDLTVIVNTGDDFEFWGLKVSPDLDTVCYTLAGLENPQTGWGRKDETWTVFEGIKKLGGASWFRIGDKDLSTHLERSRRLSQGKDLSEVMKEFCTSWGIGCDIFPMTNEPVMTLVETVEMGWLPFQEYFVKNACEPKVKGFTFSGIEKASICGGVKEKIKEADFILFCPSNPWVSIDPILKIPGMDEALKGKKIAALSPIIGGKTVKGPAAKMFQEMGITPSALAVCEHYRGKISHFVLDHEDRCFLPQINDWGIIPYVTDIIMRDVPDRKRLALEVLRYLSPEDERVS